MSAWDPDNNFGGITSMEERMKIMYNEHIRSPTHSVPHYISYLRRYVSQTGEKTSSTPDINNKKPLRSIQTDRGETKPAKGDIPRTADSISPLSYFIRKLKLDLKMSFPSFVEEFIQAPNNGLGLLLSLLKIVQAASMNPAGSVNKGVAKGTLKMENYKQTMVDEQDCLLCIKYTLRIRVAVDELLEHNCGLFTVTTCILSNFSRSRIAALEILSLVITGPSSVDKVLEAFTSMRIMFGETTRFKMLINMMHTRGVSQVLFQVSCLRLLNTLVSLSKSANMRVFLQYEMEEAGLNWAKIQEGAQGDGLEFDDLRKEIMEWRLRYIDVDSMLRKIKADLKAEHSGSALSEFQYDLHYGQVIETSAGAGAHSSEARTEFRQWRNHEQIHDSMFLYPLKCEKSHDALLLAPNSTTAMASNRHDSTVQNRVSCNRPENQDGRIGVSRTQSQVVTPRSNGNANSNSNTDSMTAFNEKTEAQNRRGMSLASEIYEPYGLILKAHSLSVTPSDSGSQDRNWILSMPVAFQEKQLTEKKRNDLNLKHNLGHGEMCRSDAPSDRYDSGVCINYQDIDPADELANVDWQNVHTKQKVLHNPNEASEVSIDASRKNQVEVKERLRDISKRNDTSEQGPLKWYNPSTTPLCSINPWEEVHTGSTNGHQNATRLTKPPTPTPDYSNDDFEDSQILFSPKQSSTMRAGWTSPAARSFCRVGNRGQINNESSNQNGQSRILGQLTANGDKGGKKLCPPSERQILRREHALEDYGLQMMKGIESKVNSNSHAVANLQPKNLPHSTLITRTVSEYLKTSSAASHIGYPKKGLDDIISPTTNIMSNYGMFNGTSKPSLLSVQSLHEVRHKSGHPREASSDVKSSTKVLTREEKLISRSLLSLTPNDSEHVGNATNRKKTGKNPAQNTDVGHTPPRRASVSEYRSACEPVRRSSLVTATRPRNMQGIKEMDAMSSGLDSLRSYSAEIGRVLSDLDLALEKHSWQASLKADAKLQRQPLIAYV